MIPQLLLSILRTRRAHGSIGDLRFRSWLHERLNALPCHISVDKAGNIIARNSSTSRVAFSSHIDTCHSKRESRRPQDIIEDMGFIMLAPVPKGKEEPGCLGADDGAGIYIMLRMLAARVPGTYIFHVGEEVGGIGSDYITTFEPEFMKGFDLITAFDRAVEPGGVPEVITVQGGRTCASDDCGWAIAESLNDQDPSLGFEVSHNGVFTDTRTYSPYVPECINLGVFYTDQHGPFEILDPEKLEALTEAAIGVFWEDITIRRRPVPPPVFKPVFTRENVKGAGLNMEGKELWLPPKDRTALKGLLTEEDWAWLKEVRQQH